MTSNFSWEDLYNPLVPAFYRPLVNAAREGACQIMRNYPSQFFPAGMRTAVQASMHSAVSRFCSESSSPIPPFPNPDGLAVGGQCPGAYFVRFQGTAADMRTGVPVGQIAINSTIQLFGKIGTFRTQVGSPYSAQVVIQTGTQTDPDANVSTVVTLATNKEIIDVAITSISRVNGQPDTCTGEIYNASAPIQPVTVDIEFPGLPGGGTDILSPEIALANIDLTLAPEFHFTLDGMEFSLDLGGLNFNFGSQGSGGEGAEPFDWDRLGEELDQLEANMQESVAEVGEAIGETNENVTATGNEILDSLDTVEDNVTDTIDTRSDYIECLIDRVEQMLSILDAPEEWESDGNTLCSGVSTLENQVFYCQFPSDVRLLKLSLSPISGSFNGRVYKLNSLDDEMEAGYGTASLSRNNAGVESFQILQHQITWFRVPPHSPWECLRISLKPGITWTVSSALTQASGTLGDYATESIPPCQVTS